MKSGSKSPQYGHSDPGTSTSSEPGTPTVIDLTDLPSDHPRAVNMLALGLTVEYNNGIYDIITYLSRQLHLLPVIS